MTSIIQNIQNIQEIKENKENKENEENESIEILQPSQINIPLFMHQLKSIENMEKLEKTGEIDLIVTNYVTTRLGVLADLPGYGKSLSAIGLIARTLNDEIPQHFTIEKIKAFSYVSYTKTELISQLRTSLIVVNVSLLGQWTQEMKRTLLRFIVVHNRSEIEEFNVNDYDVVIVSNTIYNLFSQVFRKKAWKRMIIDEPVSLKIPSMEETHARFYWLVTGTPQELYHTKHRRVAFMNELLPDDNDIFNYLILKNDDHFVKGSYEMPTTYHKFYKCKGNISTLFEGIVSDTVIEMIQSNNIQGAFHALDSDITDQISLFEAFYQKKNKRLEELHALSNIDDKSIEKIEVVENHISILNDKILKYIINNKCVLCNNTHDQPSVLLCCHQIFCGKCTKVDEICKLCKSSIKFKPIEVKDFNNDSKEDVYMPSNICDIREDKDKISTILSIILQNKEGKFLIFSNYNETFSILKRFLDEKQLTYLELRGTKEKRDNTIDLYKTGNVNILLLNTIHSGAGLNLQETSDIILYHHIHEYQKIQVIGRANRIGRKIPLTVHYLE